MRHVWRIRSVGTVAPRVVDARASILPDDPITPGLGNAGQAVERTGELSGHCGDRIGIVGQVGREQHGTTEVGGAGDRPDGGFEGVDDVPAGADRVPRLSTPAAG